MYQAESYLSQQCLAYAANVRKKSKTIARRAGFGDQLPDEETLKTLCTSAVFLAFIELGGDSDHPARFPWEAKLADLVTAATRHVVRDVLKPVEEERVVGRERPNVALVEQFRWDAWSALSHGEQIDTAVTLVPLTEQEQEAALVRDHLTGLAIVLEELLSPTDWALLKRHYLEGVSQADMMRDLMAAEPERYHGTRGVTAAKAKIAMGIMRARQRAQRVLGNEWAMLAMEVP